MGEQFVAEFIEQLIPKEKSFKRSSAEKNHSLNKHEERRPLHQVTEGGGNSNRRSFVSFVILSILTNV